MKAYIIKALCFWTLILFVSSGYGQKVNTLPDRIPYRKGIKWGYCDRNKKIVIPAIYDKAALFGKAPAHLEVVLPDSIAWVKKGNKEYWISKTGKLQPVTAMKFPKVVEKAAPPPEVSMGDDYPTIKEVFTDEGTGKQGVISYGNKKDTLLPARFEKVDAEIYTKSDYIIVRDNGKWGIVKARSGKWIVQPEYDEIERYDHVVRDGVEVDAFRVKRNGLTGFAINDSVVVPATRYKVINVEGRGLKQLLAGENVGRVEFLSMYGKILTGTYEEVNSDSFVFADIAPVKKKGKWGLIDLDGRQLTACKYDESGWFDEKVGLCEVFYQGKPGYIDAKGTEYFED